MESSASEFAVPAAARVAVRVHGYRTTLLALALLTFAISVAQTAVTPALPVIQAELGVTTTSIALVLVAYSLATAVATPIVGRLGDIFGRNRLLTVIVCCACVGCLVAALAHSLPVLVTGRALQGIGGAIFALAFAVVRDELPAEHRPTGYGVIGATWGVGAAAGYPLSGVIVGVLSYEWIFWIGLLAIAAGGLYVWAVVPPSPVRTPTPVDWVGAILFSVGAAAALFAISKGLAWGWGSPRVVGLALVGALSLLAWVVWELRVRSPLVDVRLLRLRGIWTINVAGFLAAFGRLVMFLLVPKFAQTPVASGYGFGDSVARSSIYLLPMALMMLATSLVTSPLARRFGARAVALAGAVASAVGLGLLAFVHTSPAQVLAASALMGVGIGLNFSASTTLINAATPHAQIGEANGMSSMLRTVGGAVGAQVAATIVSSFEGPLWPDELGYTISFALASALSVAAFAALCLTPARRRAAP